MERILQRSVTGIGAARKHGGKLVDVAHALIKSPADEPNATAPNEVNDFFHTPIPISARKCGSQGAEVHGCNRNCGHAALLPIPEVEV